MRNKKYISNVNGLTGICLSISLALILVYTFLSVQLVYAFDLKQPDAITSVVSVQDAVPINEGHAATTHAIFSLTLDVTSTQNITVEYATSDGTALAPGDYIAIPTTTLTFPPGEDTKTITVTLQDDQIDEDDETFFVQLGSVENADIGNGQAQGMILDDDKTPSLSISNTIVSEGAGESTFTVRLDALSSKIITVDYATSDGTAQAPDDYLAIPTTTLTFQPGEITKTITVTVIADSLIEDDETFFVNLTNAANANISEAQAQGVILDDDVQEEWTIFLPLLLNNFSTGPAPVFDDDFSTSQNWAVLAGSGGSAWVAGGEYHLQESAADRNVRVIAPVEAADIPAAYSAETAVRLVTGAGYDDQIRYGIVFDWKAADQFYMFIVQPLTQEYWIYKYQAGWVQLAEGSSGQILTSSANKLSIERIGERILVYANDVALTEIADATYLNGQAGLFVISSATMAGTETAEAAFDYFRITPTAEIYQTPFNQVDWEVLAGNGGSAWVTGGEYHLQESTADRNVRVIAPVEAADISASYAVETTGRMLTDAGYDDQTRYGILFDWKAADQFYMFIVRPLTQEYWIYRYQSGWVQLAEGSSGQIQVAHANQLKVERLGNQILVYANDALLTERTDATYLNGQVGLFVISSATMAGTETAEAAFDYFHIQKR